MAKFYPLRSNNTKEQRKNARACAIKDISDDIASNYSIDNRHTIYGLGDVDTWIANFYTTRVIKVSYFRKFEKY
jgi:hypothetical protein